MAGPDDKRRDPLPDEQTVESIEVAVKLAVHSLEGLNLSDEELDTLCDTVFAEPVAPHKS